MLSSAAYPLILIAVPMLQVALVALSGAAVSIHFPPAECGREAPWEERSLLERIFSLNFYFTLGCALLCFLFAVAGHVRLDAPTLTLIAGITALAALFHLRRAWFRMPPATFPTGILPRLVIIALFLMIVLNVLGTLSPEVRFDPLAYHLQVPRLWLNFGRMVEVPENGHSYFPYGFEMLYAWSLSLGSDSASKAMHCAAGISGALWCARIARRCGASSLYAGALYYFIHSVSYLSTTAYIDLATGMYALAAVAILTETFRSLSARTVVLIGIFTAASMTTKYTAWPLVGLPMTIAMLIFLRRKPALILAYATASTIVLLPWIARNIAYVGNPVAPLMIRIFGPQSAIDTGLAGSFDAFAGSRNQPLDLLLAPLLYARHLLLQKYTLSILGMLGGVMLLVAQRKSPSGSAREVRLLLTLLAGSFLAEALFTRGHPDGRYAMSSMGIGGVLVAVLCARLGVFTARKGACLAAPLLCLAMFASALRDRVQFQAELKESWYPILAKEAREEYLAARNVQPKDFAGLEDLLAREHARRVIGINYPSHHRYWVWIQGMRNEPVTNAGGKGAAPEKIRDSLLSMNVTHVVDKTNPGFDEAGWVKFLDLHTTPVGTDAVDVRALKPLTAPSP
ncbi:hypothetical protein IT570_12730 [Candidatus Sumerlaeota bacterium]|nr:hypothetical protein [Candidatus Sumerlaeota bacterium]